MASPRTRRIIFWITTVFVALPNAMASTQYLAQSDAMAEKFASLGYPAYFMVVLGVGKLLGASALLIRRVPQATEWAYAGFFFVFGGGAISHLASGDPLLSALQPLVFLGALLASYRLQPRAK